MRTNLGTRLLVYLTFSEDYELARQHGQCTCRVEGCEGLTLKAHQEKVA